LRCPPITTLAEQQKRVNEAQSALASCVLSKSWFYCAAGVVVAVPLGVKLKSYTPLAYAALGGTAADLLAGYSACTAQREELRAATEEVKRAQEARSSQKAAEE